MSHDSIDVVGVPPCGLNGGGAWFEATGDAASKLRMTHNAISQCAALCSAANLADGAPVRLVSAIPASAQAVAPVSGSNQVLMTLVLGALGPTRFELSNVDAVVLAAQLLDASTAGRKG